MYIVQYNSLVIGETAYHSIITSQWFFKKVILFNTVILYAIKFVLQ